MAKKLFFLTKLEGEEQVKILDPATTALVQDTSKSFEQTLLYIESQLRQTIANDEHIHIAHKAAMDIVPYQLDPAIQALNNVDKEYSLPRTVALCPV